MERRTTTTMFIDYRGFADVHDEHRVMIEEASELLVHSKLSVNVDRCLTDAYDYHRCRLRASLFSRESQFQNNVHSETDKQVQSANSASRISTCVVHISYLYELVISITTYY